MAGIEGVNTIHFSKDEIRRENQLLGAGSNNIVYRTPIKVDVDMLVDGEKFHFTRQKKSVSSSRSTIEPRDICKKAESMARDSKSILPIISYQSFSRISNQKKINGKILFLMIFPELLDIQIVWRKHPIQKCLRIGVKEWIIFRGSRKKKLQNMKL